MDDEDRDEDGQRGMLSEQQLENERVLHENGYDPADPGSPDAQELLDEDPNADDPDNDNLRGSVPKDEQDGT